MKKIFKYQFEKTDGSIVSSAYLDGGLVVG
jgi:hypothetical protein